MNIQDAQKAVDAWIEKHGVRYFNELTNMAQLTEEVGEVARIIARMRQGRLKRVWFLRKEAKEPLLVRHLSNIAPPARSLPCIPCA